MKKKNNNPDTIASIFDDDLTQVERIQAHFDDGLLLDEADVEYLNAINMVFKIIHNEENHDASRRKLRALMPNKTAEQLAKMIEDAMQVYGDFFRMSVEATRVIQVKAHQRVYEGALLAGDFATADTVLNRIDKLLGLHEANPAVNSVSKKLPTVRRTTDVAALKTITGHDPEDEETDEG